jgi:hypothetical protein
MNIPASIKPQINARACGGWIARSPDNAPICMGETGNTETEAVERFRLAWEQWRELVMTDR